MTAATLTGTGPEIRLLGLTISKVQAAAVWLMFAASFFVIVEPAPCDLLFVAAFALHLRSGLAIPATVMPLILYLLLYNTGGFLSYLQVADQPKTGMFVITSAYMALAGVFLAFFVAHNPLRSLAIIKNGYVIGAFIASCIALAGYFNVGGLAATLSPMARAQGTFKDPNVLSTYLILPALMLIQGFMLRTQKHRLVSLAVLLVILGAWFLAFSRGAWISLIAAAALMVVFTFALTPSARLRSRIVMLTAAGFIAGALLIAFLLSIPEVRELFFDRLTLVKYYDAGEKGRFGNQVNSIQYLLQLPLGFGPRSFYKIFGQDPHNVFLNAFASYGWLGGISYLLLVVSSIMAGFRAMLIRTPWQHLSIAAFCGMLTTMLQGVQIDTDHWRHFYWMVGICWGLFAASVAFVPQRHSESVD